MKPVIILLALACAGLLWMRHDNSNLRASFERANRVSGRAVHTEITGCHWVPSVHSSPRLMPP